MTRRALLKHLDALLDTTEDVELQNDLLTARARMLDDHKAPRAIRTIELLRLLHGLNTPHVLTFWMLLHIISDAQLLERVRKEADFAASIVQEKPVMGFTVPPRVTIDPSTLLGPKTPLLEQCWLETARLYSRGQKSWTATEDFELEGEKGGVFASADKWAIQEGDWIDIPLWHGNNDGMVWDDPAHWKPERHTQGTDSDDVSSGPVVSEHREFCQHKWKACQR
jgi:cytochrome P450